MEFARGLLSSFLFAIYIDGLIDQLRYSEYCIHVGNMFAGCLMYADDIVLLSYTWYGLQELINSCYSYGKVWNIRFNPLKARWPPLGASASGCHNYFGKSNQLLWQIAKKYLRCHFASSSAEADSTVPLSQFYGSLNNILNVLGYNGSESLAVHLAKSLLPVHYA